MFAQSPIQRMDPAEAISDFDFFFLGELWPNAKAKFKRKDFARANSAIFDQSLFITYEIFYFY